MVIVKDSRPYIELDGGLDDSNEKQSSQRWQYASAIESIEISSQRMKETVRFSSDDEYKKSESFVQQHKLGEALLPPCWSIDVQPKRGGNKTHNVIFNLLDISGVRFSIELPTAQARLDGIEPDYTDDIAELQKNFNTPA